MNDFISYPLSDDFTIELVNEPAPIWPTDLTNEIEDIWEQELKEREGFLFNGSIFNAIHFDGKKIKGRFEEYKHHIAQLRNPDLKERINLKVVSVSGLTICQDHILIGLRSNHVTLFKNHYELVPSGIIDKGALVNEKIEILRQIEIELKEEANISLSQVTSLHPWLLIFDKVLNIYEVWVKIEVDPSLLSQKFPANDEYDSMIWIDKKKIFSFIEQNKDKCVPLTLFLLERTS